MQFFLYSLVAENDQIMLCFQKMSLFSLFSKCVYWWVFDPSLSCVCQIVITFFQFVVCVMYRFVTSERCICKLREVIVWCSIILHSQTFVMSERRHVILDTNCRFSTIFFFQVPHAWLMYYVYLCLSVCLSVCLSIYLSIYLFVYLSCCLNWKAILLK